MPDCLAADIRLCNLPHIDGALHPGIYAPFFQRILKRQTIHHRRQHPHIIRRRAIHALRASGEATPNVAAADDHRTVDSFLANRLDLCRNILYHRRIDAKSLFSGQGLSRKLQDYSLILFRTQQQPSCPLLIL